MLLSFKITAAPLPFVAMAKHDPLALVDLLDKADPNAVSNIIALLQKMIEDNSGKVQTLEQTLKDKEDALKTSELDANEHAGECGSIKETLEEEQKAQKVAEGVYTSAKATRADRDPKLQKEIATLKSVLAKVKSLQTSSGQKNRRLLAFDSVSMISAIRTNPNAFIESLMDADPQKLQLVINLIDELITAAQTELDQVIRLEDEAFKANKDASERVKIARQHDGTCQKILGEKNGDVAEKTGERDVAKKAHDTRKPILLMENVTLNEIIELLRPMAKKD